MELNETYYAINIEFDSDEDGHYGHIYKLCSFGQGDKKVFAWIGVEHNGGIGTGVNEFGEPLIQDAFIHLNNIVRNCIVKKATLEEAIKIRNQEVQIEDAKLKTPSNE